MNQPRSGSSAESIALCVITYRRPAGLIQALESVARLRVPTEVDLSVVVVDNDAEGQGAAAAETYREALPFRLTTAVEPERGIPAARNRCVALAGDVDGLVFLDDDEMIDPDWLIEMIAVRDRTTADVVMGPGVPVYPPDTPPWVIEGGFFEMEPRPDGSELPWNLARTSGVWVARRAFELAGSPAFDRRFALTGGEDIQFFLRAHRAGARFAWAAKATVEMPIASTRVTARWILRRGYRIGTTRSLVRLSVMPGIEQRAKRLLQGFRALTSGLWHTVSGIPRGKVRIMEGLRRVGIGAGTISGAVGLRYDEYRNTHGS